MNKGKLAGKKILITGHTGFTGSWATTWLRGIGAELCGYSLKPDTWPSLFEAAQVQSRLERHYEGDISDYSRLLTTFKEFRPELVLHLAAQPLVIRGYREPRKTFMTNVAGTANVLEAASRTGVKGVVSITTDKVYQDSSRSQAHDEDSPLWGIDPYSSSKVGSELVVGTYRRLREIEPWRPQIISVRGGNIIGGGDWSEDRLIPDAIRAWLENRTFAVRNPSHTRPWQHVIELVDAYLNILSHLSEGDESLAGSYNVGPPAGVNSSVESVVQHLTKSLGVKWEVGVAEVKPKETQYLSINSQRIYEDLGWVSKWDQEVAIEKTVDWYLRFYNGEEARDLCKEQIQEWELDIKSESS